MPAPTTAYAELGLSPDADRGAVDRAYRALMKLHHPDRGGDPTLAAAINRAYAEITRPAPPGSAIPAPDIATAMYERRIVTRRAAPVKRPGARRGRRQVLLLLLAILAAAIWIERDPLTDALWNFRWRYFPSLMIDGSQEGSNSRGVEPSDTDDAPIRSATITRSVEAARAVLADGGLDAAGDASGRCYHGLMDRPSFAALDGCLAFDDAIVLLAGSAATQRRGFGAVAVTARQLAAGRAMGGDYSAIEDRLDRVRLLALKAIAPAVALTMQTPRPREKLSRS